MLKRSMPLLTAILCLLGAAQLGAQQTPQMQQLIAMVEAQYKRGEFKQGAQCLGVSEQAIFNAVKKSLSECASSDFSNIEEEAFDACTQSVMRTELKVTAQQMSQCEAQADSDTELAEGSAEMQAIDAFMDSIGDRDMTEAEAAELERLSQAMEDAAKREFEQHTQEMADMMRATAIGTEELVTLPLYGNASIDAHYPQGFDFGNFKTLPVAMFSSADKAAVVLAYYQKKLPGYKLYEFEQIGYMLLEKDPGVRFEFTDFAVYKNMPHVLIESLPQSGANVNTRISLFYRQQ